MPHHPRQPITPGSLDITESASEGAASRANTEDAAGRPCLRVFFACANQYIRVYRDPGVVSYLARCPKCGESKRFMVGPGGSEQRFFSLTCK